MENPTHLYLLEATETKIAFTTSILVYSRKILNLDVHKLHMSCYLVVKYELPSNSHISCTWGYCKHLGVVWMQP